MYQAIFVVGLVLMFSGPVVYGAAAVTSWFAVPKPVAIELPGPADSAGGVWC